MAAGRLLAVYSQKSDKIYRKERNDSVYEEITFLLRPFVNKALQYAGVKAVGSMITGSGAVKCLFIPWAAETMGYLASP